MTGAIQATTVDAGATAIVINAGSSVHGHSTNTGTIRATISSPGQGFAYGVRDLSGTLTTINNSGIDRGQRQQAQGHQLCARSVGRDHRRHHQPDRALAGTAARTATTSLSGISGNIITGSGNDTITASGGTIAGNVSCKATAMTSLTADQRRNLWRHDRLRHGNGDGQSFEHVEDGRNGQVQRGVGDDDAERHRPLPGRYRRRLEPDCQRERRHALCGRRQRRQHQDAQCRGQWHHQGQHRHGQSHSQEVYRRHSELHGRVEGFRHHQFAGRCGGHLHDPHRKPDQRHARHSPATRRCCPSCSRDRSPSRRPARTSS